jgi:hypothetical protein
MAKGIEDITVRALAVTVLTVVLLLACSKPSTPAPTTVTGTNTTITGTVVERLDGPPYSYLSLRTDKGEVWAAVSDGPGEDRREGDGEAGRGAEETSRRRGWTRGSTWWCSGGWRGSRQVPGGLAS